MRDFLEQIKTDYDTPQDDFEAKIYKRYADRTRKFSIGYAVWCHASFSLYIIGPFLNHTEERPFPGHTKYPLDEDKYYWFIVSHQSICTFTVSAITAAVDALFVMLVHHICAKFAVLGYNLEKIGEDLSESPSAQDELETYKKIVNCVKKHKEAIGFADSMESAFSIPTFINLTMNMIVMSTSGFVMLANVHSIPNLVKYIGLSVTLTVHLFFMSWPAQEMMDHSAEICEFAYFASWYRTSQRSKNLLKFLMMRSQVPCKLTTGKLYVMSLENFCAVRIRTQWTPTRYQLLAGRTNQTNRFSQPFRS
ncbi:odorant receptor 45b isoform X1 [Cephus cinctus]|uniref:Odorant receptor 45b isoform X1 n=1 Tax=Cephus cinctus TaxID=211228 RepID=A0AAJ7W6B0_CEPCN|nr:odorant receptor 45b isoform X1 [Cephus cinctus]